MIIKALFSGISKGLRLRDISISEVGWIWHKQLHIFHKLTSGITIPLSLPLETWVGHAGPAKGLLAGLAEWMSLSFIIVVEQMHTLNLQKMWFCLFYDGFDVWVGCHFNVVGLANQNKTKQTCYLITHLEKAYPQKYNTFVLKYPATNIRALCT